MIPTVLALIALAIGCSSDPFAAALMQSDQLGRIEVAFGTRPERLARDGYQIDEARIAGDTLIIRLSHGGGCRNHGYGLVAWNGWLESHPVQVGVLLIHEDNDDHCRALLRPELRFDLTPLRLAYLQAYRTLSGTISIGLNDPTGIGTTTLSSQLSYTF